MSVGHNSGLLLALVPGPGLLFGLLLLAAILGGYLARALRLPRVIGYLLAGAGLKLVLHAALDVDSVSGNAKRLEEAEAPLAAIKDLGLGLILFSIGGVFERRRLQAVGRHLWKIAVCDAALSFLLVFTGTFAVALAVTSEVSTTTILSFATLLALASIATAPAATLFVLQEYDAKGPVTDTILGLTGLNNVVCIILFHVCFLLLAAAGVLQDATVASGDLLTGLSLTILGSIALGIVIGFALSLIHARLQLAETLLIFIAVLIVLGAGEKWLLEHRGVSYNALLTVLCIGAAFANLAIDPDRLDAVIRTIGGPILVGFFALAGYQLHLGDIPALGPIGAAYVVCRLAGKVIGARLGLRWSRPHVDIQPALGTALLCQAAVVIALADFVFTHWKDAWAGPSFMVTVLGSVVLFEIAGPVLTKRFAVRAGEVKAVTLLRRTGDSRTGGASLLGLTWEALRRTLGLTPNGEADDPELRVRHVMRANIKCLHADANLDEVLHFVERSRYNHFPVIDDDDRLVGVIHFADIREMLYDPLMRDLVTAVDLANPTTRALPVDMPLTEALAVFRRIDVGSLPVVDQAGSRHVVGVIEQRDLLRALHRPNGASG